MKIHLLYLISLVLLLFSCGKEKEEIEPEPEPQVTSCRVIESKSVQDGYALTFTYNANGLLTKRETGFPNAPHSTNIYEMEYDATGKLLKMVWRMPATHLYYHLLYNYNSSGQMVRLEFLYRNPDGSFVPVNYYVYEYNSPDELKSLRQYKYETGGEVLQQTHEFFYEKGLMVRVEVKGQQEQNTKTYHLEYDDKKNPANQHGLINYQSYGYPFKHNITKTTAWDYLGQVIPDESSTTTYTYNQQGYPLTQRALFVSNRKWDQAFTYSCE